MGIGHEIRFELSKLTKTIDFANWYNKNDIFVNIKHASWRLTGKITVSEQNIIWKRPKVKSSFNYVHLISSRDQGNWNRNNW